MTHLVTLLMLLGAYIFGRAAVRPETLEGWVIRLYCAAFCLFFTVLAGGWYWVGGL